MRLVVQHKLIPGIIGGRIINNPYWKWQYGKRMYSVLDKISRDNKRKTPISLVTNDIKTLICFSLLRSTIRCLRGLRSGVVVITTAQLHSTKPELRLCAGSNPARGVSEIHDGEDLSQWSRLEIRLKNAFRRLAIPQKQFIIIDSMH